MPLRTALRIVAAACVVACLPSLCIAGSAAAQATSGAPSRDASARDAAPPSIERYLRIRAPGAATFGADGTLYVRDWPDGIFQLYRVEGERAAPGTATTKLTAFPDGLSSFRVSPDGTLILLMHAVGGNENTQVSLLDPSADGGKGRIVPLLASPRVRHTVGPWLADSRGFLYSANAESPNDFHLHRFDLADDPFAGGPAGTSTRILDRTGSWSIADVTDDGGRAIVGEFRSATDTSLYELDLRSGELRDLTPKPADGGTVAAVGVAYAPGEQAIFMLSDVADGITRLHRHELADGALSRPLSALDPFEVDGAEMNRERTLLAVTTNEEGFGVPHLYRLPGLEPVEMPALEPGVASITGIVGDRVVVSLTNARTPGVAFTFEVPPAGGAQIVPAARQVTFVDDQGLDLSSFPLPALVKYPAFDGLEIPAFVYLPPGHASGTPIPFVVQYHGGPEGQHRPTFNPQLQYLVSQGFGVLLPNVRGSSGYGRAFLSLDDYRKRWDSVKDGVDAAAWLVSKGIAVPGRIATMGGSYGGYMAMACLVEDQKRVNRGDQPQRLFGAGVKVVGIVNLQTFLEKTAGYRRKLREAEYGPLSDPEFLASVSPMTYIEEINVPVFIAHGFNDPRVPVEEAMQLAVALKDRGLDPQVFIAPDEGHGFAKLDNRLYYGQRVTAFLKQHLRDVDR
ncbi:MAG TPA: S9 family peptidase [Phycisphaerales bacterium]|nr:S9 family peptidase [Phycisphaerales bacterium]HMP38469.1 S9 family peptidase [Phycisphaerales bacterium]